MPLSTLGCAIGEDGDCGFNFSVQWFTEIGLNFSCFNSHGLIFTIFRVQLWCQFWVGNLPIFRFYLFLPILPENVINDTFEFLGIQFWFKLPMNLNWTPWMHSTVFSSAFHDLSELNPWSSSAFTKTALWTGWNWTAATLVLIAEKSWPKLNQRPMQTKPPTAKAISSHCDSIAALKLELWLHNPLFHRLIFPHQSTVSTLPSTQHLLINLHHQSSIPQYWTTHIQQVPIKGHSYRWGGG